MRNTRRALRRRTAQRAAINRRPLPEVAQTPAPAGKAGPPEPIEHPTIHPTHPRWYRVLRPVNGSAGVECIGEFPALVEAMVFAAEEKWRAVVVDGYGKKQYDSWRDMKRG